MVETISETDDFIMEKVCVVKAVKKDMEVDVVDVQTGTVNRKVVNYILAEVDEDNPPSMEVAYLYSYLKVDKDEEGNLVEDPDQQAQNLPIAVPEGNIFEVEDKNGTEVENNDRTVNIKVQMEPARLITHLFIF